MTGKAQPVVIRAQAHLSPDATGTLIKVAHGNMDGVTVFHCPFCFSSDSRYITRDGIKTFGETVGTTQWVLSAPENERTGGTWVEAHIHEFGEQSLMKVTLQRNGIEKIVEATPEHRWLVKANLKVREDDGVANISRKGKPRNWRPTECKRGHDLSNARVKANGTRDCQECARLAKSPGNVSRSTNQEVQTKDLRPGQRLSSLRPQVVEGLEPSHDGIRHGIVFGDGSRSGEKSANVILWGEKDKQLLQYFPDRRYSEVETKVNKVHGIRISGNLFGWMKELPSLEESDDYLYGWLAGYFAADGCVSSAGVPQIDSANKDNLEFVRAVANRLGISTYGITMQMRKGFPDRDPSAIYSVVFLRETLHENFFLIEDHRNRFMFGLGAQDRFGWTVKSVEMTDKVEPVFCAVVPETHSFALEDNIWVKNCGSGQVVNKGNAIECGFCHVNFSVLVQPQFAMMPQTIDGQPFAPGQPPGGGPAPAPADAPGGEAPPDDEGSFGGDQLSEKVDQPEKPEDDEERSDSEGGNPFAKKDDGADKDDKDDNPFAKSSFITVEGVALSYEDYQAYLALKFSNDRQRTLAEIQSAYDKRA